MRLGPDVDLDASLINVHSEKEQVAPTFKRGFGYHPLCAFVDHGQTGSGEPLAIQLRPGNAAQTPPLDLPGWPPEMRVIVRKERPHPGAQLRIIDHQRMRITAFATNTPRRQLPVLELRHRLRARCEDQIRNAKDTGLMKFPLQSFAQNQVWSQFVQLASELVAWMQTIALSEHDARKWEPKRLRARPFQILATLVRRCRHKVLHLAQHTPEVLTFLTGIKRLRAAVAQT